MANAAFLKKNILVALSALLLTAGCATDITNPNLTAEQREEQLAKDPNQGFNRAMFSFNTTVDGVLIRPIASIYRGIVPEAGREGVTNFLKNLSSPVTFANSVAQGDVENSFATFWRFVLNTTFGFGGVYDFASEVGLKNRPADFGQTLAKYGFPSGDYIVVPFIGPSTTRDFVGRVVDYVPDPVTYAGWEWSMGKSAATAVDFRSNNMKVIDDVYSDSLDPYSTIKSGWAQHRTNEIRKVVAPSTPAPESKVKPKAKKVKKSAE